MSTPFGIPLLTALEFAKALQTQSPYKSKDKIDPEILQRALDAANAEYRRIMCEIKHESKRGMRFDQ
jgi:hypothetical protein